jgi:hypothetical protein
MTALYDISLWSTPKRDLSRLTSLSDDTNDENIDSILYLDTSMKSNVDHLAENFCEDWVSYLKMYDWDLQSI